MKRIIIFLLTFILLLSAAGPVFANMDEKLQNHWSKNKIDTHFLLYYFPYLAKEDFKRLSPDKPITENEFLLSFSSVLKEKGYEPVRIGWRDELSRIEMVSIIGDKLLEIKAIESTDNSKDLPFIDAKGLAEEQKEALMSLYNAGIIHGQSNTRFDPHASTTQAEAIIVLQMVNNLLDDLTEQEVGEEEVEEPTEIPFTLSGIIQSYSGEESIISKVQGDNVMVTATKMFPTPGYSVEVDRIMKDNGELKIYLNITPPDKDSNLPQVLTYKTITIEIDKEYLGEPPYNFVWGNILPI